MSVDSYLLPDVQDEPDRRGVELDDVGIAGLRLPIEVATADGSQATVAVFDADVNLPAAQRGTHMSRIVETLVAVDGPLEPATLTAAAARLRHALDAGRATITAVFPLFVDRPAPVTGRRAPLAVDARMTATSLADPPSNHVRLGVTVPVTSLCPCSKEISDYGAHNQRGRISIDAEVDVTTTPWLSDLVAVAESSASAPVHPLLKREDEREVTMAAYDNPKFVEDAARDAHLLLRDDARVLTWMIEVVNEESIHAHDAIARVRGRRR